MQKGVSPDKYRSNWGKFNETSLPEIWKILMMQVIHVKILKLKKLGEYYDLYDESNTLLLTDAFESLRNKCFKIYEFDPAKFLSAPRSS